ncbi:MAG TPA: NUDIX domain-containing protein [Aliiroseovarius sp.]|nr:NUDIX domain-containing protein [Aliiroseovarius sp.]
MQKFTGTKLVLMIGDKLVTILRDDIKGINWPGHWDLPGGGREGDESPEQCVLRELREELGLALSEADLIWKMEVPSVTKPGRRAFYFAARLPAGTDRGIVFGDEGQEWRLVPPDWFIAHPMAVPHFRDVVRDVALGRV